MIFAEPQVILFLLAVCRIGTAGEKLSTLGDAEKFSMKMVLIVGTKRITQELLMMYFLPFVAMYLLPIVTCHLFCTTIVQRHGP